MPHRNVPQFFRSIFAPFLCALLLVVLTGPHRAAAEGCAESPAGVQASTLYSEGESEAALPYAHEALHHAVQQCGAQNIAIVILLSDLGAINQDLGRYADAEKQLKRVIAIKQAALSPEEENKPGAGLPDMIIDFDNLAFVYGAQGKFAEAGKLFERVLAIAEHAVGENHIIVAQALRNLAENYRAEGRHDEAIPLLARAARIEAEAADDIPANWADELGLTSTKVDSEAE
ncbi:MAG: tetratricopeptide repeat protein [Proteobacteria bacterium]|nr:tetratricopeptide repeat protein [Pseudomonadota bacterium]MDA1357433.1 tetratricopeptide repeat protein [Pseudomonadota bacterium]